MPFPILAVAGLALAAYGAIQKAQSEKKARQNLANRPTYNPLPEDPTEMRLAENMANTGMSGSALQQLQNNTDRLLSTSANSALMSGGDPNTLATIVDRSQNAYNQNALYEDQARQQNLRQLLGVYSAANQQRQFNADKQFQVNQYGPWADRQQLYAQGIAGGQQTMTSGISMFGSGLASYVGNMGNYGAPATASQGATGGSQGFGSTPSSGAVPYGGYSSGNVPGTGASMGGDASSGNVPNSTQGWGWNGYMPVYR